MSSIVGQASKSTRSLAYPPVLIRVKAVYYTTFSSAKCELGIIGRRRINILNKMTEFRPAGPGANSARERPATGATAQSQTPPARPVSEPL